MINPNRSRVIDAARETFYVLILGYFWIFAKKRIISEGHNSMTNCTKNKNLPTKMTAKTPPIGRNNQIPPKFNSGFTIYKRMRANPIYPKMTCFWPNFNIFFLELAYTDFSENWMRGVSRGSLQVGIGFFLG